eukprot:1178901-Prorocentrum_minimum.AAC.5
MAAATTGCQIGPSVNGKSTGVCSTYRVPGLLGLAVEEEIDHHVPTAVQQGPPQQTSNKKERRLKRSPEAEARRELLTGCWGRWCHASAAPCGPAGSKAHQWSACPCCWRGWQCPHASGESQCRRKQWWGCCRRTTRGWAVHTSHPNRAPSASPGFDFAVNVLRYTLFFIVIKRE